MNIWREAASAEWKLDEDELVSARKVLEKEDLGPYKMESIPLPTFEGSTVIAFSLPDMLRTHASTVREFILDSACKFVLLLCDLITKKSDTREYKRAWF